MDKKELCKTCMVPKNQRGLLDGAPCSLCRTWMVIFGRWKMDIIWNLRNKTMRFSEIEEKLPGISSKVLTTQLRELEADGLIQRTVYEEIPPRVEYTLTSLGKELIPGFEILANVGKKVPFPE